MTGRHAGALLSLAAALVLAAVPLPGGVVERVYSVGAYPRIERLVTAASDAVPWALLDAWIVCACLGAVLVLRRFVRGRRQADVGPLKAAVSLGCTVLVAGACAYLVFMVLWGLNYRRQPIERRLDFEQARISADRVVTLADQATRALNELHEAAHSRPWPEWDVLPGTLGPTLQQVARDLRLGWRPRPGRPKRTLLATYFRWAGIAGLTNPFGLEVLPSPDALPFERQAVMAHEWAHLAGFAHEAEAGFVAWLVCVRAGDQAAYSGWFSVWPSLVADLPQSERGRIMAQLTKGPRADLQAMVARNARAIPSVRTVAWEGYDAYLRSQRVPEGVASYAGVVRLLAGTDLSVLIPARRR